MPRLSEVLALLVFTLGSLGCALLNRRHSEKSRTRTAMRHCTLMWRLALVGTSITTCAGRLVRELKRNLGENSLYTELIDRKPFFRKDVTAEKSFIPFTKPRCNVSVREKNTRSTNSATRSPSYVRLRVSFLVRCLFVMNMTDTR